MKYCTAPFTLLLTAVAAVLGGCSSGESRAIEAIKHDARDPESVQVRNLSNGVALPEGKVLCGEWNAKNGFGGMGEWEGFMLRANTERPLYVPLDGKPDPDGVRQIAQDACPGVSFP